MLAFPNFQEKSDKKTAKQGNVFLISKKYISETTRSVLAEKMTETLVLAEKNARNISLG